MCDPKPNITQTSNTNGGNASSGNADKYTIPEAGIEISDFPAQSNGDN